MATKKVNYGTKKLVRSDTNLFKKPLFLLAENLYSNQSRHELADVIQVKKCFCSGCKSTFDVDLELKRNSSYWADANSLDKDDDNTRTAINDLECPECHNSELNTIVARTPDVENKAENHINMSQSWHIPAFMEGHYVFEYTDDDGTPTRIDDNYMSTDVTIFPSGKKFQYSVEISETTDLVKNDVKVTKTKIIGENRELLDVKSSSNKFAYAKIQEGLQPTYNVKNYTNGYEFTASAVSSNPIYALSNGIKPEFNSNCKFFNKSFNTTIYTWEDDLSTVIDETMTYKRRTIEQRFKDLDSVYKDSSQNGLYLKEYHPGSNEENTNLDNAKISFYYNMIVRYPVAYEYACSRVDDRVLNHKFSEQRKANDDSSYVPREIPDSAKAKMLREELKYVGEQLCACDDKILKTIGDAKNLDDMKQKLQFFVFGNNEKIADTQVPKHIALKDGQTSQSHIDATKALKASFNKNPIGTASTVYTCHKLGIKDTNHINQMIAIANTSPDVNPAPLRRHGQRFQQKVGYHNNANANVLAPIVDKSMMQFARNYANTHSHTDVVDAYKTENFDQYKECARIYSQIVPYAKIADKELDIKENLHAITKNQIRNYLTNKTVKDAYIDFIEKYGKDTPDVINSYVAEIKQDKKNEEIKRFYDKNGIDSTLAKYADDLSQYDDPKSFLENYDSAYENTCILMTRNNKPLFRNRNLYELHEELSHLAKNVTRDNIPIEYTAAEKALEAEYEAPDGSGTWSFSLHKDTFEMVRTATEMSNCLASHTSGAPRKGMLYLYMKNELGEKVACISINNRYSGYSVGEFQAPHDNAVDGRYKDICLQWLQDHDIEYRGNSNVAAFGTGKSLIGGHDADYHSEEVDEVNNARVSTSEMRKRTEERTRLAKEIYGVDANGEILVPEVPGE